FPSSSVYVTSHRHFARAAAAAANEKLRQRVSEAELHKNRRSFHRNRPLSASVFASVFDVLLSITTTITIICRLSTEHAFFFLFDGQ
ncbi:hypothetical protein TYRP_003759, partial [Tyrophagus putrescentiae]